MDIIDIIIPVYKAEETLSKCLDSLLAQTYPHWRAILIDDCSPDNSRKVGLEYAVRDSRITYLINEKNLGVAATRNRALKLLKGQYVAFLDSDDWWEPQTLERMHATAAQHRADIVQCSWFINYPDGTEIAEPNSFDDLRVFNRENYAIPLRKMFTGISMNHVARKLVRRELFQGLEFSPALKTGEDLEMSFQLLLKSNVIAFIPESLYHYYRCGTGLTGSGISFLNKWRGNCQISAIMLKGLKGTNLNTPTLRLLAWLRPFTIIMGKVYRTLRDKRSIDRSQGKKKVA